MVRPWFTLPLMLWLLAACAVGPAAGSPTGVARPAVKLNVVATFSILGDLVRNVGGDRVDLHVLVPAGVDAHTFEPTPADSVALARAALVFENGVGFDAWLDKLDRAAGTKAQRVVVTDGIPLLKADEQANERQPAAKPGEAKPANDRASGKYDPHVWHDVRHAMQMTGRVRDALIQADAANADAYRANADRFLKDLAAIDAWVAEQVGQLPADRRQLITTHDTFGYFAARYGFTIVGTALGSVTTEAGEPSAGEFAKLVGEIKAAGVPAIFAENVSNPKLMERLAREAGVALGPPLYTDALGPPGSDGDSYLKMMRANVTALTSALGR